MVADRYRIAETEAFVKRVATSPEFRRVYPKIRDYVYPLLRENPFFGPNIKRLKGEWSRFYRYRVGSYRLLYTVHRAEVTVFVVTLTNRKETYRR